MRFLLDTQAFLWYVLGDPRLSSAALSAIGNDDAEVFISPASYWEIAIKASIGKYELKVDFNIFWQSGIADNAFQILPIEIRHASAQIDLPYHHRDPFDRLLVAQAMIEDIAILSADAQLDAYPIKRIW